MYLLVPGTDLFDYRKMGEMYSDPINVRSLGTSRH